MPEPPDESGESGEFDDFDGFDAASLDEHESAQVKQDLIDLTNFETTFRAEGYRGVSVFCRDCDDEHFYPWDMLRENLTTLLETGESPVHEPAFAPNPEEYIPWEYARGYVDALHDAGVNERLELDRCRRCGYELGERMATANFCPRCGVPLVAARLAVALEQTGMSPSQVEELLRSIGIPG